MSPPAVRKVILAAGGSGGHLFPAEALARELLARGRAVVLITDRRGSGFSGELADVPVHRISAGGLASGRPSAVNPSDQFCLANCVPLRNSPVVRSST